MWLGQSQLGLTLDIHLQVRTAAGVPVLPDAVPGVQVRRASDNAVVFSGLMPIVDASAMPGQFRLPLFLGLGFAVGSHLIRLAYSVGGTQRLDVATFSVLPGGEQRGQALGMYYFHKPHADFVVWQAEVGLLLRGKNPSV